jgi:hypothetical protein
VGLPFFPLANRTSAAPEGASVELTESKLITSSKSRLPVTNLLSARVFKLSFKSAGFAPISAISLASQFSLFYTLIIANFCPFVKEV